uniref:Uncharacterized protein n=1 Tax=Anopheles culicifacies TaxID=139723 RepID=A0A182MJF1_9DIPT
MVDTQHALLIMVTHPIGLPLVGRVTQTRTQPVASPIYRAVPSLPSGLPKDSENDALADGDCCVQCPQCHQTVQGIEFFVAAPRLLGKICLPASRHECETVGVSQTPAHTRLYVNPTAAGLFLAGESFTVPHAKKQKIQKH